MLEQVTESNILALVFSQGCDARLSGIPKVLCPYTEDKRVMQYWRWGWEHVHNCWGQDVNGRWSFSKLPCIAW